MEGKLTLSSKGEKSVIVHASNSNTKLTTVAVTILPMETNCLPLLLSKGLLMVGLLGRTCCIWIAEHFICVKNAWMDEMLMIQWVDNVLSPYIFTALVSLLHDG